MSIRQFNGKLEAELAPILMVSVMGKPFRGRKSSNGLSRTQCWFRRDVAAKLFGIVRIAQLASSSKFLDKPAVCAIILRRTNRSDTNDTIRLRREISAVRTGARIARR